MLPLPTYQGVFILCNTTTSPTARINKRQRPFYFLSLKSQSTRRLAWPHEHPPLFCIFALVELTSDNGVPIIEHRQTRLNTMEEGKKSPPTDPEAMSEGGAPPGVDAAWADIDDDPRNFVASKKWTIIIVLSFASFGV